MTNLHDAAFQEQAIAQWRDWRHFLSLHLKLIDVRSTALVDTAAFEVEDSAVDREHDIRRQLAVIPGDARALFERVVEERRHLVQAAMEAERRAAGDGRGHPLDADEVERAALTALLDEAEGASADGIGQVPMADGWYDVDAEKLRDVPDETRYRLAGTRQLPAARLAAIAGVVLLGAAAIWLTRPGRSETASAATPALVLVNDQPAERWAPRAVTFVGEQQITLPVVPRSAGADPQAAQWETDAWPLAICAPETTTLGLTSVRVMSAGDAPDRTYVIRDIAPEAADLAVASCGDSGERVYGTFQSAEPQAMRAVGEAGQLGDGRRVTLRAVEVVGPGQDPKLPQGKAQIVITADAPAAMDWSRVNALLRWQDGQDLLPSESASRREGATFRYLVPLFETPIELVQWRVTDPATGETIAWQSPIDAPPTRPQVVARALADVQARAGRTAEGALQIALTLKNGTGEALALAESDLTIAQDGRRLPIPTLEALRAPLAAGEQRVVNLIMNTSPRQALTLSIGSFVFQITG